jgi:hypothetical protein
MWTGGQVDTGQVDMWTSGAHWKMDGVNEVMVKRTGGHWTDGQVGRCFGGQLGRWTGEHVEKRKGRKLEYRGRLKGREVNRWKGGQVER